MHRVVIILGILCLPLAIYKSFQPSARFSAKTPPTAQVKSEPEFFIPMIWQEP